MFGVGNKEGLSLLMNYRKDQVSKGKKKALGKGLLVKTMIDSALIELQNISIPDLSGRWQTKTKTDFKWQQQFNPNSEDYFRHGYLPNITVVKFPSKYTRGWFTERVVIQASVPKVLYGTNYFGVNEKDYDAFIQKLVASCKLLGLPISQAQLEQAALRAIALCFNFMFDDKFPYPLEYLKKMGMLDIGKRYSKVKNTDFIEDAEGYQGKFYNGQVGWGLYDKRAQLLNDAKTKEELEVVEKMKQGLLPDKVLRMEITYQNQTSVKQHLTTRLGGDRKQPRHVSEVFDNYLVQNILTETFNKLSDDVNVKALEMPIFPQETAIRLMSECGLSQAEALAWMGFSLCVQQTGSLATKEMLDRYFPRQYRNRLDKALDKSIKKMHALPQSTLGQIFEFCRKQLKDFIIPKPNNISFKRIKYGQLDLFPADNKPKFRGYHQS